MISNISPALSNPLPVKLQASLNCFENCKNNCDDHFLNQVTLYYFVFARDFFHGHLTFYSCKGTYELTIGLLPICEAFHSTGLRGWLRSNKAEVMGSNPVVVLNALNFFRPFCNSLFRAFS